jgi:phytoene/squalene synthetase
MNYIAALISVNIMLQGMCYFPSEVMKKHGLSARAALQGPQSAVEVAALQDVVNDIASQAHAHLSKARELLAQGGWPAGAHFALLPAVGSQLYLDALQKDNFLPQEGNQHLQFVKLQMRLMKYLLVKKF